MSGKQEESPRNFDDLYEVDYKTGKVRKLADITLEKEHRTLGNSLVIDKESGKIYALTFCKERFDSDIRLLSLDMNTFQQDILGEPIPYRFLDTESFADIYFILLIYSCIQNYRIQLLLFRI